MRPSLTSAKLYGGGGKPLIIVHIENWPGRFNELIINHATSATSEAALGDGSRFGVSIRYSSEIELGDSWWHCHAMPLLGPDPLLVVTAIFLRL